MVSHVSVSFIDQEVYSRIVTPVAVLVPNQLLLDVLTNLVFIIFNYNFTQKDGNMIPLSLSISYDFLLSFTIHTANTRRCTAFVAGVGTTILLAHPIIFSPASRLAFNLV